MTDPFGQRIDYGTDKAGKLKGITGTPFDSSDATGTAPVTNYIDDIQYRAWGAVKSIDYGNSTNLSQTFNSRLQVDEFRVWKDNQADSIIKKNYQYYNDGQLKFSSDSGDATLRTDSHRFDRSYAYDYLGRLTAARTGTEARSETTAPDRNALPYRHDYAYNAFGNVTSRQTYTWTQADNQTSIWTNNRESTWQYDSDGRLKQSPGNNYDYDAGGSVIASALINVRLSYRLTDGEGKTVRRDDYKMRPNNGYENLEKTEYSIYSSVLGKVLTELNGNGTKKRTFVYGQGGKVIAAQNAAGSGTAAYVEWENTDPSNASFAATSLSGAIFYSGDDGQAELDPEGSNVGASNPYNQQNSTNLLPFPGGGGGGGWGDPFGGYSCRLDGFEMPCGQVMYVLSIGAGNIDFGRSDGWALGSLGIISRWESTSGRPKPNDPNTSHSYGDGGRWTYTIWGNWETQVQTLSGDPDIYDTCADKAPEITRRAYEVIRDAKIRDSSLDPGLIAATWLNEGGHYQDGTLISDGVGNDLNGNKPDAKNVTNWDAGALRVNYGTFTNWKSEDVKKLVDGLDTNDESIDTSTVFGTYGQLFNGNLVTNVEYGGRILDLYTRRYGDRLKAAGFYTTGEGSFLTKKKRNAKDEAIAQAKTAHFNQRVGWVRDVLDRFDNFFNCVGL